MQNIILTLIAASIGAWIGLKLRIPAGAMIGAMAAVVIFNILTEKALMTAEIRTITQVSAGALIGSRITRDDIYGLKKVFLPAMILVFGMIILNFTFGFIIYRISELDLATALFATAPGGLSDMSLIADDLGADSPKVAILQLIRIIVVISIFPFVLKHICSFLIKGERNGNEHLSAKPPAKSSAKSTAMDETFIEKGVSDIAAKASESKGVNLILTLCIASFGGTIGILLRIPAGAMVVSMIAVVAFTLFTGRGYFPRNLRIITQIITGSLIGSRMTWNDIEGLKNIIAPTAVMVIGMLLLTLVIGYAIHKLCKLDLPTALLSSTPGGLQEMSLLAEDFGADAPKVAVIQLFRLLAVISVFPSILKFVFTHW